MAKREPPPIAILCVEDEPDVLDALVRDLAEFEEHFQIDTAADTTEARAALQRFHDGGIAVGLIFCDHILPGENGVDLLIALHKEPATQKTRKVLFTGQAGLEATVAAVNRARLDYYIAKPWKKEDVVECAREQLTRFVLDQELNPLPYMSILDATALADAIAHHDYLADR